MDVHNSVIVAGAWGGSGRESKWEVNRQNIYGTLFLTRKCNNMAKRFERILSKIYKNSQKAY